MSEFFDAFRLYDQEGLPLSVSIAAGSQKGMSVNLAAFACDALAAGWAEDKISRVIGDACADNAIAFDWSAFREKLAALWTAAGRASWAEVKRHLVEISK